MLRYAPPVSEGILIIDLYRVMESRREPRGNGLDGSPVSTFINQLDQHPTVGKKFSIDACAIEARRRANVELKSP